MQHTNNEINIRIATADDLAILYEFEQGIIAVERPFDPTLKDGLIHYYDIAAMIEDEKTHVLVACYEQQIIASAYGQIREAKPYLKHSAFLYMGFMFVLDSFRGKGVNKLIINALFEWAKSNNIHECRLDVYDDNPSAIRAYEKAGFKKHLINMRIGI